MKPAPYLDGWHAHRLGESTDLNPHHTTLEAFSHSQWSSGWHERRDSVEYGLPLLFDVTLP